MQEGLKEINDAGVNVLGVSYDSPDVLKKFADKVKIEFPLLSDPESKVIDQFELVNKKGKRRQKGIAHPMTVFVATGGKVLGTISGKVTKRHNAEQLIEAWAKFKPETTENSGNAPAALNFKVKNIKGDEVSLADNLGKVVVVVNVASKCGLTPQYESLQGLYEKHADDGLVILGFPCNQFGGQEPGSEEEIQKFCKANYGVKFDMFSKVDVNGENQAPLYKFLNAQDAKPKGAGDVNWNFEKFVIDRSGNVAARFGPRTKPDSKEFSGLIENLLESKGSEDSSK